MTNKVRVRFAPSPTGALHMGGVRTALFNYLFAKQQGGDFLLRIEDTDQTRFVPGAEEYIIESLKWCGLTPDEGVGFGGDCGPYRQSERKAIYKQYADQLVAEGNAYYAFDTPEELNELRTKAEAEKLTFSYDLHTRGSLVNSLTLSAEEVQTRIARGDNWVIRFKMPENVEVVEEDMIRGTVKFNTNTLDDKVLFKTDGMPTYHLANIVDDHLMHISHVIRGEEWLPSMPLHVLLYKALGWGDNRPQFAHLPLILKPTGKGKLSKRDGDKMGFPVFPMAWKDPETGEMFHGYKEDGYFPEAFLNMLALLGWNDGSEQEFFSMEELIAKFSLDRVVKSGARFNPDKAKWFNHHYMQTHSDEELAKLFTPILLENEVSGVDESTVIRVISLVKERCEFVQDLWAQSSYFFQAPTSYDEKTVQKKWKPESAAQLGEIMQVFTSVEDWKAENIKEAFSAFMNEKGWGFGVVMVPIRLALVGSSQGADLFEICEIIGKEKTISRMKKAVEELG
ncbi:MAG: glutamate--tRNA ligase [Mangrovibacterium sp.]